MSVSNAKESAGTPSDSSTPPPLASLIEISPLCLPSHPAAAYLCLVRPFVPPTQPRLNRVMLYRRADRALQRLPSAPLIDSRPGYQRSRAFPSIGLGSRRTYSRRESYVAQFRVNQLPLVTKTYPTWGSVFRSIDRSGVITAFWRSPINSEIFFLGTTRASSTSRFHS